MVEFILRATVYVDVETSFRESYVIDGWQFASR